MEFPLFVRAHTAALLRSAYLLTGDRAEAEELVQDTFVRLYPNWTRVLGADVPIAYVRRSMTNNFLNGRRRKSASEFLFADPPEASYEPDLARELSDRELVRDLLNSLPAKQRAVLVLSFFDDLSDEQSAADVGCRPATVRNIVSRALMALRTETERRAAHRTAQQTNGNLR